MKEDNNDLWPSALLALVSKQSEKYYMFYAGNGISTTQYGIGLAVADALSGPYHKLDKPFIQSTNGRAAPGHSSITTTLDGKSVMFYMPTFRAGKVINSSWPYYPLN